METVTVTIRIPKVLWDQREKLLDLTGAKSVNAMIVGLYVYAMMHGRPHWATNAIFRQAGKALAETIDGIVARFKAGLKTRGNYFEAALERSVDNVAKGQKIPKDAVISDMIEDLRKIGRGEKSADDEKPKDPDGEEEKR